MKYRFDVDSLRRSTASFSWRIRRLSLHKAIAIRHRAANRNPVPAAITAERDRQLAAAIMRLHVAFARIERKGP